MDQIRLRALAKINLGLDVVRRRDDGYHEVRMIMQTINLYDQILITRTAKPGIQIETNLSFLPVNENNLVYKAAALLMDEFGIRDGVFVKLGKRIPVAAGMAGGSSDAAAVLYGMNRMFHLNLSKRELMKLGVKLGADVPYCIMRGTALAEGIGEKLTPLPPMPKCYVVIAKPGISISTRYVYEHLDANHLSRHAPIGRQLKALRAGDLEGVVRNMENVLETVTLPEYPVVAELKDRLMAEGALGAMMSGSGPTVFGLFDNMFMAERACAHLREDSPARLAYMTSVYNNRR